MWSKALSQRIRQGIRVRSGEPWKEWAVFQFHPRHLLMCSLWVRAYCSNLMYAWMVTNKKPRFVPVSTKLTCRASWKKRRLLLNPVRHCWIQPSQVMDLSGFSNAEIPPCTITTSDTMRLRSCTAALSWRAMSCRRELEVHPSGSSGVRTGGGPPGNKVARLFFFSKRQQRCAVRRKTKMFLLRLFVFVSFLGLLCQ